MAGAKSEDKSEQYIMKDGVDVIYTISSGNISAWTDTSAFDLRTKFILLPMITDVEKLTVGFDGKDNVFELSRTKDEEKSTEDKPAYTYTCLLYTSGAEAAESPQGGHLYHGRRAHRHRRGCAALPVPSKLRYHSYPKVRPGAAHFIGRGNFGKPPDFPQR